MSIPAGTELGYPVALSRIPVVVWLTTEEPIIPNGPNSKHMIQKLT